MDAKIDVELDWCLVYDDYYCLMRVRDSRHSLQDAPDVRRRSSVCPVLARRSLLGNPVDYSVGLLLCCVMKRQMKESDEVE